MSVFLGKSLKRVQRISRRILSKQFVNRLHDLYFCHWEFKDNSVHADQSLSEHLNMLEQALNASASLSHPTPIHSPLALISPIIPEGWKLGRASWANLTSLPSLLSVDTCIDESRSEGDRLNRFKAAIKN